MSFNVPEFTVAEFSRTIKRVVEDSFGYVKITGEITGFKRASSGHLYFSLKDDNATLSAVCFRNVAGSINFEIADGLQITASGRVTTFEGRSNYQIIVEKVEISGIGAILEMIEKRRKKLSAEGLFDQNHKQKIPFFPKVIGVITSETGAVLQDIKHRIEARCPTHIKLCPTLVQGEKAVGEIISAIKFFNKLKGSERPQVIIIARGGGSFEDLLAFNDESLVRSVFASDIPVISAIGHETDTSLIDFVSDLRAPTPTAAAEFATPVLSDLSNKLTFLQDRLSFLPRNILAEKSRNIENLQRYIIDPAAMLNRVSDRFVSLEKRLSNSIKEAFDKRFRELSAIKISNKNILYQIGLSEQRLDHLFESLRFKFNGNLESSKVNLKNLNKLLKSHHYNEILKRGFSLVKDDKGEIISSISQVKSKQKLVTEVADGEFESYVMNVEESFQKKKEKTSFADKENSCEMIQPKFI